MNEQPTLTERKRREAADELVETAVELFERDGFEATKVEAIAARAGCSPRTFYRYFGTKEDVVFHDIPAVIARLGELLDSHLATGAAGWAAVSQAVMEILGRFDDDEQHTPIRPIQLWLREPALRARYMQHLADAERAIVDSLCRHGGTSPGNDHLAQLMAIAAIGAYRTTVTSDGAAQTNEQLTEHLRELLGIFGRGLDAA